MTADRRIRRVTERDRDIQAYVAENPGSSRGDIAAGLGLLSGGIAHRLMDLTADGYIVRADSSWHARYSVGRPLPGLTPHAVRTCAACGGRWVPSRAFSAAPVCPPCRRIREVLEEAVALGVGDMRVTVQPGASRASAPDPFRPSKRVWVDTIGDLEAIVCDRRLAGFVSVAA
jgi:hypothetical protein